MGSWVVDRHFKPGILYLRCEGQLSVDEVKAFVAAHNRAIAEINGAEYRVFCDITKMRPLDPDSTRLFEEAKRYSSAQPNFQGSAVLAHSAIVTLQHKRTSVSGGVMDTELISDDEAACWAHLDQVRRQPG